ncbi:MULTISPECIES: TetR family transcriptional regulator [unclassified Mycobacterium]|uniref:TetR family transcriptional regulator n=1 Tax=unclassified Mycobacterium TaxID=2642494 RepID=UPI0029C7C09C|nr:MULTISPECIES: TetR family transcriptional regulator [unclassified Mycobacterium]
MNGSAFLNRDGRPAARGHIGTAIRSARQEAGLTVRDMAERLHVSVGTVSAIENGKTGVSVVRLEALARVLGTSSSWLLARRTPSISGRETGPAAPASDWRSFPALALDPILDAAIDAFVEIGYHGTSMRLLAERAGLSVPGIYHHYRDKQALLVRILDVTMAELHWRVDAARREAKTGLMEVALIVEALALFHTHHRKLAFIGASEMRSLTGENRRRIAGERTRLQHILDVSILRASSEGYFDLPDVPTTGRAIATMCTSLPQWFRPDGPDSAEQISRTYVLLALAMLHTSECPKGFPDA